MVDFVRYWALVHVKRYRRSTLRELVIGVGVGLGVGVLGLLSPSWLPLIVLVYLLLSQIVYMNDNIIFLSFSDFRMYGFREPNTTYRLAVLVHYVLRDKWLANAVMLVTATTFLCLIDQPLLATVILSLYASNLLAISSHLFLAYRLHGRGLVIYLGILGLNVTGVGITLGLWGSYIVKAVPTLGLLGLGLSIIYGMSVEKFARKTQSRANSVSPMRFSAVWTKKWSVFFFKDMTLFAGMAFASLVAAVALFALLAIGSPSTMIPLCGIIALLNTHVLMNRRKGKYRIIDEDYLFDSDRLMSDRVRLRRAKMVTLGVVFVMQLLICFFAVAMLKGAWRWSDIPAICALAGAIYVLDAPLLYIEARVALWLRGILKYGLAALYLAASYLGANPVATIAGSCILIMIYMPSLLGAISIRPRTNAIGHEPVGSSSGIPSLVRY